MAGEQFPTGGLRHQLISAVLRSGWRCRQWAYFVARYGGEEFVAIIHFNLNRELLQFLKRIKTIVTENSFIYKDQKIRVTFSAGVTLRSSYDTYENALQKADMLLYQAKESGRNKIVLENGMEI